MPSSGYRDKGEVGAIPASLTLRAACEIRHLSVSRCQDLDTGPPSRVAQIGGSERRHEGMTRLGGLAPTLLPDPDMAAAPLVNPTPTPTPTATSTSTPTSPRPARPARAAAAALAFVLALAVLGPRLARAEDRAPRQRMAYDPSQPVPAGYHVEHRRRWGLAIPGALLFAATYVPTAMAAFYDGSDGTPLYVVPILGPIFAIPGKTRDDCTPGDHNPCFDFSGVMTAFLIADTLAQTAGLVMLWQGWKGRDILVRNEGTDGAPSVALVPGRIGASGYGAWLTGRF